MPSVSIPSIIGAGASIGGSLISAGGASDAANAQLQAAQAAQQTQLQMYQQTRSDLAPFMNAGSSALSQLASIFGFSTAPPPSASGAAAGGATGATGTPHGSGGITTSGLGSLPGHLTPTTSTSGSTTGASPAGAATAQGPNAAAALAQLTKFPGYQFGLDQGQQALDRSAASRGMTLSGAQLKASQEFGNNYAQQAAWAPYISELNNVSLSGQNAAAGVGSAGTTAGAGIAQSQLAAGQAQAAGSVAAGNAYGSALAGIGSAFQQQPSNFASGNYYAAPSPQYSGFQSATIAPNSVDTSGISNYIPSIGF